MIDQLDSEYIYVEMFRALDTEGTDQLEREDLEVATKSMGWNSKQGKCELRAKAIDYSVCADQ